MREAFFMTADENQNPVDLAAADLVAAATEMAREMKKWVDQMGEWEREEFATHPDMVELKAMLERYYD